MKTINIDGQEYQVSDDLYALTIFLDHWLTSYYEVLKKIGNVLELRK